MCTLDNFLGQQAPLLRSAVFIGIRPMLKSPFPFLSLTQLDLYLLENTGPLHLGSLLSLYFNRSQLQGLTPKSGAG